MLQPYLFLAYFVNALISLAEMWRKKMEAMKDRDRTRTMNGSLKRSTLAVQHVDLDITHILRPGESSV